MCATDSSTIAERINQLRCSVKKFLSYSYSPKEDEWKDMDALLRTIEEQICVILAYSILRERNADRQIPPNLYGQKLVVKVKDIFTYQRITDTSIIDRILADITTHNQNCHGTNVSLEDRKRSGKINVEASLPLLSSLLKNNFASFPYIPTKYKDTLKRFGSFMEDAATLLKKPIHDPRLMDRYRKGIASYPLDAQPGPYHFCLILPANPSEGIIKRLRPLLLMKWAVIIDEGYDDGEAYKVAMEINPEGIQNTYTDKVLHENLTNWLFIKGIHPGISKAELRSLYKNLSKKPLPERNIIIIDLVEDKEKSLEYIELLWQLLQSNSKKEPSQLSSILTIDKDSSLKSLMSAEDYKLTSIGSLDLSPEDFLSIAASERLFPGPTFYGDISKGLDYTEYHGAGIKFLDSDDNIERKSQWDEFYAGRQITVEELERGRDVTPRGKEKSLRDFENSLRDALKNPETGELMILHQPGAGGSTLMRRIAFGLRKENLATTVFLTHYNPTLTIDLLSKLYDSLKENGRLLIVADDKEIEALNYENIKRRLNHRGVYPVFVRIIHRIDLSSTTVSKNTLKLRSSIIDSKERSLFDDKFKGYYLQFLRPDIVNKTLVNIHSMDGSKGSGIEMIYYPYAFTDVLKKKFNAKVYPTSSYVEKWFNAIGDKRLQDLCGLVAFVYRFTAAKALDVYTIAKLWKSGNIRTLESFGPDIDSLLHILKFSIEETSSGLVPTSLSPRYAVFAESILDKWSKGWQNSLSMIARKFIEVLPEELPNDADKSLVLDLFVQQARLHASDVSGLPSTRLSDRFSLLIGTILDTEEGFNGARAVFEALIEKYPDDPFFKIHYGRLLYEYAHANKYSPRDELFKQSIGLIEEALHIDEYDDFHHMAGMYWSRIATAWSRMIDTEDAKTEDIDLELEITECVEKALASFNRCNELNFGSSPYGYVSATDILLSAISYIVRVRNIDKVSKGYLDESPFLEYLELIDEALANLGRLKEEGDNVRENPLDRLFPRYLEIIGKSEHAITLTKEKYSHASDDLKHLYGHRIISMVIGTKKKEESKRDFYRNMQSSQLSELKTMLGEIADLRSYEALFTILRYTNNDEFGKGPTFDALMRWYVLATEQKDIYHMLRSSYFLYISYAAQLSVATTINQHNQEKYNEYKKQCRDLVLELPDDIFRPSLFLGKSDVYKWDSILDASEARKYDTDNAYYIYSDRCRRVDAKVMEVEDYQAFCEVNSLNEVSFKKGKVRKNEKGKTWLRNGVIGFRYNGPGLFKFEIDRNGNIEEIDKDGGSDIDLQPELINKEIPQSSEDTSKISTTSKHKESPKALPANEKSNEDQVFKLDSEKRAPQIKVLGTVDLSSFENSRRNKRKSSRHE